MAGGGETGVGFKGDEEGGEVKVGEEVEVEEEVDRDGEEEEGGSRRFFLVSKSNMLTRPTNNLSGRDVEFDEGADSIVVVVDVDVEDVEEEGEEAVEEGEGIVEEAEEVEVVEIEEDEEVGAGCVGTGTWVGMKGMDAGGIFGLGIDEGIGGTIGGSC